MSDPLLPTLAPFLRAIHGLDLTDRHAAEAALARAVPDEVAQAVTEAVVQAHTSRGLTPKRATPTLTFGRLAKAGPDTLDLSIDAVDMQGAGAAHTHPQGEVSWCIPLEGAPTFEGVSKGWAVMPPGSRHVPEVTGGRMLILYFLPGGAMSWSD